MKKVFGIISFIIILLIVITGVATKKPQATKDQELEMEKHAEIAKIIYVMVNKYNAITDWGKRFEGRIGSFDTTYTIEVQDAIVKTDGRPILFFNHLNDVVKKGEKYFLYFGDEFGVEEGANIHFILECTPGQAEKIMVQSKEVFDNYAVVGQITEVKKIRFQHTYIADEDADFIDVEFAPSNVFIANGVCLDFVFVGHFYSDNWREILKKEAKND